MTRSILLFLSIITILIGLYDIFGLNLHLRMNSVVKVNPKMYLTRICGFLSIYIFTYSFILRLNKKYVLRNRLQKIPLFICVMLSGKNLYQKIIAALLSLNSTVSFSYWFNKVKKETNTYKANTQEVVPKKSIIVNICIHIVPLFMSI